MTSLDDVIVLGGGPAALCLAAALAEQALFITSPNPRVGCVIVGKDGTVLGQGHTQAAGQAHAEVMALRDAQSRGHSTQGATAYVTLEPCSHHGRTGPCSDALIAAGLASVVASVEDPNPLVAGQGLARLQAAGVQVDVGLLSTQSIELNMGFFKRMQHGTPWMRMKSAQSLDGQTALHNGQSQWITGEAARLDGHRFRAQACAVLTGIGTVLADDPRLDVRDVDTPRQPVRVVIDSALQTPPQARLFEGSGAVWIYAATQDSGREAALKARGAHITHLPDAGGKVDLRAMLADLARREINEVHVEAGSTLNGSLMRADLVDELLIYLAPTLLGPGQPMINLPELQALNQARALEFIGCERIGPDLRLRARLQGRDF